MLLRQAAVTSFGAFYAAPTVPPETYRSAPIARMRALVLCHADH